MARPNFEPTLEQRRTVKALAGGGMKQEGIAKVLEIRSLKTLRKHFRKELELGLIQAAAQVFQTYLQMAASGKYPAVTLHWIEKHPRWREVDSVESKPAAVIPDFVVSIKKEAA